MQRLETGCKCVIVTSCPLSRSLAHTAIVKPINRPNLPQHIHSRAELLMHRINSFTAKHYQASIARVSTSISEYDASNIVLNPANALGVMCYRSTSLHYDKPGFL
ncbi:unnamed protein product [Protopolystoma xenopodis]|uniref:Uncharacterized protein n=1 Tax=Protopolystoma xenopodis TaxID=117903 RepID=A0A448WV33_9PLAT|nr:unnamed protein product [Protopolystoma xenopodis]